MKRRTKQVIPVSHYYMTDFEKMRIRLLLSYGGFHHRTIASRIFGTSEPTNAEVARVSRVAQQSKISTRDWRNGKTTDSRSLLTALVKTPTEGHVTDVKTRLKAFVADLSKKAKRPKLKIA